MEYLNSEKYEQANLVYKIVASSNYFVFLSYLFSDFSNAADNDRGFSEPSSTTGQVIQPSQAIAPEPGTNMGERICNAFIVTLIHSCQGENCPRPVQGVNVIMLIALITLTPPPPPPNLESWFSNIFKSF